MSNDSISTTTRTSWLSRLGSAFGGVLTGLALIVVGIGLLAWNEGRSVQAIRVNKEGSGSVISVAADRIIPANEGRLIHVSAPAVAEGQRRDTALGVAADGLLLTRTVEYFQWVETSQSEKRTRLGGGEETVTTYSYDRQWTRTPVDSSNFQQSAGRQNPVPAIKDARFEAETARIGAFKLDRAVLDQVSADSPLPVNASQAASAATVLGRPVQVNEDGFYIGANPAAPQVGDMRVTYLIAPQNGTLSLIGSQTAGGIQPFPTKAGSPILMVRSGAASADQMFAQAKAANQTLSWILRGVGLVVLIAAFGMVLGPLAVLADVVPLFGSIVRMGAGFVAGSIGMIVAVIVIAASWVLYRPLVGLGLLAVAGGLVALLLWRSRSRSASQRGA